MLTSFTKGLVTVAGAVLLMAGSASAEGDPSLLRNKAVQKELKITAAQAGKLDALFEELGAKEREGSQKFAEATPAEQTKMLDEMRALSMKRLNEILKPEQFKRLGQIELQRASYFVFGSPKVQGELKLTDDQKAKINAITTEANAAYLKASQKGDPNQINLRKDINKETLAKIVALMTPAQKAAWDDLNGDPFEVPREAPERRPSPARRPR